MQYSRAPRIRRRREHVFEVRDCVLDALGAGEFHEVGEVLLVGVEQCVELLDLLRRETRITEEAVVLVGFELLAFVDRADGSLDIHLALDRFEQSAENVAVGDAEVEVLAREPQTTECVGGVGEDLGVGGRFRGAEDVDVRLIELPKTALLDLFVSPEGTGRDPLDGFREFLLFRDHHPRNGRREFGRHRDFAPAAVGEGVELLDDIVAGLVGPEFGAFERGRADLAEAVAPCGVFEVVDDRPACGHLVGVDVAKTLDAVVHVPRLVVFGCSRLRNGRRCRRSRDAPLYR